MKDSLSEEQELSGLPSVKAFRDVYEHGSRYQQVVEAADKYAVFLESTDQLQAAEVVRNLLAELAREQGQFGILATENASLKAFIESLCKRDSLYKALSEDDIRSLSAMRVML